MIPRNLQLFEDLVRAETRLYNVVDDRLRSARGLTLGQYELLRIIRDRESCRVLDIVREIAITVGAASKAVDRLEAAGWCRRSANPGDRRSSFITLTDAGARRIAEAAPTVEAEVTARLGALDPGERDRMATALAVLRSALERDGAGGRT